MRRPSPRTIPPIAGPPAFDPVLVDGLDLLLFLSPADGQDSGAVVTPLTAQNYVGQTATVCGQVAEYSCDRNRPFMTLTLSPIDQPKPLRIGIIHHRR